jgi:tRNA A37 threonylcarbamoyladenosine dehydratase
MANLFHRITLITGAEAIEALEKSRVIVVGLGGVGSWCAEALVRSGIGSISIVDFDTVCYSNINRQVQATSRNIGRQKAQALEERLKDINPYCEIRSFSGFFSKETVDLFEISTADYVIDAIDILKSKLDLIETAITMGKRLFSSMGMAQKLDPTLIKTADIWETRGCPLARLVRQGLKKRNFCGNFTTVYSQERLPRWELASCEKEMDDPGLPIEGSGGEGAPGPLADAPNYKKVINGSAVTVTATAGMVLASLVLRDVYNKFNGQSHHTGGHHEQ